MKERRTAQLRFGAPGDADAILAIYAPIVSGTMISFEYEPPTAAEMAARMTQYADRYPWIVCAVDGTVAGYAYGSPFRARTAYQWSCEVSVYVGEAHRGRRIGEALYVALLEMLTLQRFHVAIAAISLPNPASIALHERLGFRAAGRLHRVGYKMNAWWDVGLWERVLAPATEPPAMPAGVPSAEMAASAFEAGTRVIGT